jgi:NADH-quinone oxidoreductase subunit A
VYFAAVLVIVSGMIIVSYVLGQRHRERATGEPYESGVRSTGTARARFDIAFYMVGMFFLIFDLEAVYIYSWSVVVREAGWSGYYAATLFIGSLIAALVYLWRLGALDWGPKKIQERKG